MLLDEAVFKETIKEAVAEVIKESSQREYIGFATVKEFIEISGISTWDMENTFIPHPDFQAHVYKLNGNKRYIDIKPALEAARKIFKERKERQ
jgi:hypothetical protein